MSKYSKRQTSEQQAPKKSAKVARVVSGAAHGVIVAVRVILTIAGIVAIVGIVIAVLRIGGKLWPF